MDYSVWGVWLYLHILQVTLIHSRERYHLNPKPSDDIRILKRTTHSNKRNESFPKDILSEILARIRTQRHYPRSYPYSLSRKPCIISPCPHSICFRDCFVNVVLYIPHMSIAQKAIYPNPTNYSNSSIRERSRQKI